MKRWGFFLGLSIVLSWRNSRARAIDDGSYYLRQLPVRSLPAEYESQKLQNPKRANGTGGWLLDSPEFVDWLTSSNTSFLHVAAESGWGKSVLSRHVVEETFSLTDENGPLVLYHFFRRGQGGQDRAETALASMAHLLWTQQPHIETFYPFPDIHRPHYEPQLLLKDLWQFLTERARYTKHGLVFVFDGLDECEKRGRDQLITLLLEFVAGAAKSWHRSLWISKVLVTSGPGLEIDFKFDHLYEKRPFIRLNASDRSEAATQELDRLIDIRVPKMIPSITSEKRKSIIDHLKASRNKTHLWLELVMDHLLSTGGPSTDEIDFEGRASSSPLTLDQLYDAMLTGNDNKNDMKKALLSIVIAARRPLTVAELQVALRLSREHSDEVHRLGDIEVQPNEHFAQTIKDLFGSLLKIHNAKVFFVHETARQFVLSDENTNAWNSSSWKGSIYKDSAEASISRACLTMLSLDDFDEPVPWQDAELQKWDFYDRHGEWMDEKPFFEYAATNWVHHYKATEHELHPLQSMKWKLTDQASPAFHHWQSVFMVEDEHHSYTTNHNLVLFSRLGLDTIVERLIDEGADYDASDSRLGTALEAASSRGHEDVIRLLISRGAKVDGPGNPGLKAVEAAIEGNREGTVRLLLQSGAASSIKEDYIPALGAAISKSQVAVARLLLEHGADANSQVTSESTALVSAVESGKSEMARLLIESGANTDAMASGERAAPPLHVAVARGDIPMTRLLLEAGAHVDNLDKRNTTALWIALGMNNVQMVRQLLELGASIDPEQGGWKLHEFFVDDAHELVRLLFQHGLDLRSTFVDKILSLAIQDSDSKVIDLLNEYGVSLDVRNGFAETPLHKAARSADSLLMKELLKYDFDVNARSESGATPLHLVSSVEGMRIVQLDCVPNAEALLRHGAQVDAQDADGATSLHLAADYGLALVVKTLLEAGADVHARWHIAGANASTTPLHVAAAARYHSGSTDHADTVRVLLEHGAEVDSREDNTAATPLHLALSRWGINTARVLIERGADVNAQRAPGAGSILDEWGNPTPGETPLLAAAYGLPHVSTERDAAELVQFMIARGASLDYYDAAGRNALLAAAHSRNVVMVWVLLEQLDRIVDVNIRDSSGLTPLMLAAQDLVDDIPRMLLANGARVDDTDPEGRTALDFARNFGSEAVEACLLEYSRDAEAVRATVKHPMPLSSPHERVRLRIKRALARNQKLGLPEPPPAYRGTDTDLNQELLEHRRKKYEWHREL